MSDAPLFRGYLESPADLVDSTLTRLRVSGWVFCPDSTIRALELRVDEGAAIAMTCGLPRADVAAIFGGSRSLRSGFGAQIPMPPGNPADLHLKIDALTEDGRRIECFTRTVRLTVGAAGGNRADIAWWRSATAPLRWLTKAITRPVRREESAALGGSMDRERFEASFRRSTLADSEHYSEVATQERLDVIAWVNQQSGVRTLVNALKDAKLAWCLRLLALDDVSRLAGVENTGPDPSQVEVISVSTGWRETECWLPAGTADYVLLLAPGAVPVPPELQRTVHAAMAGDYDWLYTDDARIGAGAVYDAHLKGQFSPELALSDDYATRLAVVRRTAIERVGGLRLAYGEAAAHDLLARIADHGGRIGHLPVIACHRTDDRPPGIHSVCRRQAAEAALSARVGAAVSVRTTRSTVGADVLDVGWPPDVLDRLAVTIVIPTRDRADLLSRCVSSLCATVNPRRTRLLIVDDHSAEAETHRWFEQTEANSTLGCRVVRTPTRVGGFNYSQLMNFGTSLVETPLALHLNNDVEAMAPGWLDRMSGWFAVPAVGVVGAKLVYPDRSVQHAGVAVTPAFGTPEHLFHGVNGAEGGYQNLANRVRNVAAVTGACLLTRAELFRTLGGFDCDHLAVQFNDVDYCLRVMQAGKRIVYEPAAELIHATSATRGNEIDFEENLFFLQKYAAFRDPFISPHLDVVSLCSPTPEVLARRID